MALGDVFVLDNLDVNQAPVFATKDKTNLAVHAHYYECCVTRARSGGESDKNGHQSFCQCSSRPKSTRILLIGLIASKSISLSWM